MKRTLLVAALVALWPATSALAQAATATPTTPDIAKAQTIVNQVCAACHGADGNSPSPANPSLAAMPAEYITAQLAHFKSGIRPNPVMLGMSASLSPADMTALGEYFARQKPKNLVAKDPELVKTGQALYRGGDAAKGIPACSACHGPNGAGIPKNYPRLAGQHGDYTYAQLKAFKSGERGADKQGKDVNGRIMVAIASKLSDTQMKALAEYTTGLR
jgi:cytochrome c553